MKWQLLMRQTTTIDRQKTALQKNEWHRTDRHQLGVIPYALRKSVQATSSRLVGSANSLSKQPRILTKGPHNGKLHQPSPFHRTRFICWRCAAGSMLPQDRNRCTTSGNASCTSCTTSIACPNRGDSSERGARQPCDNIDATGRRK